MVNPDPVRPEPRSRKAVRVTGPPTHPLQYTYTDCALAITARLPPRPHKPERLSSTVELDILLQHTAYSIQRSRSAIEWQGCLWALTAGRAPTIAVDTT